MSEAKKILVECEAFDPNSKRVFSFSGIAQFSLDHENVRLFCDGSISDVWILSNNWNLKSDKVPFECLNDELKELIRNEFVHQAFKKYESMPSSCGTSAHKC